MEESVVCNTLTSHDRESPDRAIFVTFTEIYFSDWDPGERECCEAVSIIKGGEGELTLRSREAS